MSFFRLLFWLIFVFLGSMLLLIPLSQSVESLSLSEVIITKLQLALQTTFCFILPPFIALWILKEKPLQSLTLTKGVSLQGILYAVALIFVSLNTIYFLTYFNSLLDLPQWMITQEEDVNEMSLQFLDVESTWGLLLNIFIIAILPAFGEEVFFRGYLQPTLQKVVSHHVAILFIAILFSAIHLQFVTFIPRLFLGLLFGYLFFWTKKLWIPIIAHFVNNFIIVISHYLATAEEKQEFLTTEQISKPPFLSVLLSIVAVAVILYYFYNKYKMAINPKKPNQ